MSADTVIAHLDRLAAAIETGAPEHRIAQLRATYEQAEARYLSHLDSWINVVGAIGTEWGET